MEVGGRDDFLRELISGKPAPTPVMTIRGLALPQSAEASLLMNRSRPYPSSRPQSSELRDGQRAALGSSPRSRTLWLHDGQDVFATGFADFERLHQVV